MIQGWREMKGSRGFQLAAVLWIVIAVMVGVIIPITVAIVIAVIVARAAVHGVVDPALGILDRAAKHRREDGELAHRDLEADSRCPDRIADPLARIGIVAAGEVAQGLPVAA